MSRWISDPAHGWLEVSYGELAHYGMGVSDFSRYSYYSANRRCVYLEEDCDAPLFLSRARGHIPERREVVLTTTAPHSNFVRQCHRIGEVS